MVRDFHPSWGKIGQAWWLRTSVATFLCGSIVLSVAGDLSRPMGSGTDSEPPPTSLSSPHVLVLKSKRVLHLFNGDALVRTYPIDLGPAASGSKQRQGDGRTPLGKFRVIAKNPHSPYHRFLGIDYPDAGAVDRGLALGLVSAGEAAHIRGALAGERRPDWGTALGGGVGIHGGRTGGDWTAGCIALSDEHVAELFDVLRVGDVVEILP